MVDRNPMDVVDGRLTAADMQRLPVHDLIAVVQGWLSRADRAEEFLMAANGRIIEMSKRLGEERQSKYDLSVMLERAQGEGTAERAQMAELQFDLQRARDLGADLLAQLQAANELAQSWHVEANRLAAGLQQEHAALVHNREAVTIWQKRTADAAREIASLKAQLADARQAIQEQATT